MSLPSLKTTLVAPHYPYNKPKRLGVDPKALLDLTLLGSSPSLGAFSCSQSVLQTHRLFSASQMSLTASPTLTSHLSISCASVGSCLTKACHEA